MMKRLSSIIAAAGGVFATFPALAAEHAAEEGLPQFDTTLFPEQLFCM